MDPYTQCLMIGGAFLCMTIKQFLNFISDEVSIRQIAERSKKSRNTISRIITASKSVNLTPEQLDSI